MTRPLFSVSQDRTAPGDMMIVDGLIAILAVVVTSLTAGNANDQAHGRPSAAQRLSASQEAAGPKT